MRRQLGSGILVCLLTCACGCGDSPRAAVRDVLSVRNEFVDVLLKVKDEATAKDVANNEVKKLQKKWDDSIRKRLEEWQAKINSQEKSLKRNPGFSAKSGESETLRGNFPEYFEAQDAEEDKTEEIKATAKRLDSQLKRIREIYDKVRSQADVKGLVDILAAAQIFGSRPLGSEDVEWGPPLRLSTVTIKTVPLRKPPVSTPQ
jgi:hypothetical protein